MKSAYIALGFSTLTTALPNPNPQGQVVAQLRATDTQLARMDILDKPGDWLFDFHKQDNYTNNPGSVITASAANFPAVVGNKLSLALITLGPCSMLPPHIHPRASNYVISVKGITQTYFIPENGGKRVDNLLREGQMTIFPQASLHTMYNTRCDTAVLVSVLSDEDPGTYNMANSLFGLPSVLLSRAFGDSITDLEKVHGAIPDVGTGSIAGFQKCLDRCKKEGKL